MMGSGEVVYARVVARAVYLNRYICNLWSFEKALFTRHLSHNKLK